MPATAAARKTPGAVLDAGRSLTDVQRKLHSLGLVTADDCILHLPLRYEDETRIVPIGSLRPGAPAQVEGEILRSEILYRPRRQLNAVMADERRTEQHTPALPPPIPHPYP